MKGSKLEATQKSPYLLKSDPFYVTKFGQAYYGDSFNLMKEIPPSSIDLIMTSPPFALTTKKSYDNVEAEKYVDWFLPFAKEFYRILKNTGSLVIHLGGSWVKGKPVKSLYNYRLLIKLCDELGYYLAQDFYWFNKAKLPGPAQWVTVKRIRVKDSVDPIWWLSKSTYPLSNNRRVLIEYSNAMKDLLDDPNYYKSNVYRPSEHRISEHFYKDNSGAIPPNLLEMANTNSQSIYMRKCREIGISPHPARYPLGIPEFFINFLTTEGKIVLDPFAGSNTTGEAAEKLCRRWISIELKKEYLEASKFRFAIE